MSSEMIKDAEHRMQGAIASLDHDLSGFRTGRASTALLDRISVEYYGAPTPLNQMATLSAPEPRLLTIRPWDPKTITQIEKAIMASDLGLMPSNDGQVIRLPIPALTEDRREELVRLATKRVEEARVAIRNVRRDLIHALEAEDLPEDELFDAKDTAQEITDKAIELAEKHGEKKIAEIREV